MAKKQANTKEPRIASVTASSDTGMLILLGLSVIVLHILTNGQYGFHRDELQTFTNARHLAWGYVEYPPMTPFVGRLELELFGTSLRGFRFFPALAQGLVFILTGLAARELGGGRTAQLMAATAAAIGGTPMFLGAFLSYTALDFPWWILVAYLVIRLLKSDDQRWWLAIGAAIGLGMMTKYTMALLTLGVVGGVFLASPRRFLKSPWIWCGACLALLITVPNLVWQVQHHFVTLQYLKTIHSRDIRWGWTDYFLLNQLWKCANPVTLPIWCAGLWYLFAVPEGRRFRMLGWMYIIPLLALLVAKGRDYYLAPAYPMLIAAGATWGERSMHSLSDASALALRQTTWTGLAIGGVIAAALSIPLAPLNSTWWRLANGANGNFHYEIGWPELVDNLATIRDHLSTTEKARLGIWAGDDGEAGAVNLYGPARGLPTAISGMNSNWLRGYGDPPPQTVIAVGMDRDFLYRNFDSCESVGRVSNRYGVENGAVAGYADLFVCHNLRQPWPEFWRQYQYYG
jgi:4-amino-4-deoxy-L-arabinose transferase-like glycosyltransferase